MTMPSYGPSRSAGRIESGRTANGARSMSGPQAAEAKIVASSSRRPDTDGARDDAGTVVRTIVEAPVGVPLELTDPAEVVIS